jgi:hypothetical protein
VNGAFDGNDESNLIVASMDMLLRLIRDLPGSVQYLRNLAA